MCIHMLCTNSLAAVTSYYGSSMEVVQTLWLLLLSAVWNDNLKGFLPRNFKFYTQMKDKRIEKLRFCWYSWNSLTQSRWDRRKYFELSEVWVKHLLIKTVFFFHHWSRIVNVLGIWCTLHTTLILYIADSVPFGEGLSMKYTINMKHYLFIAIIIAETQQHFLLAHLSRRLKWAIVIAHRPSSVRPSVRRP